MINDFHRCVLYTIYCNILCQCVGVKTFQIDRSSTRRLHEFSKSISSKTEPVKVTNYSRHFSQFLIKKLLTRYTLDIPIPWPALFTHSPCPYKKHYRDLLKNKSSNPTVTTRLLSNNSFQAAWWSRSVEFAMYAHDDLCYIQGGELTVKHWPVPQFFRWIIHGRWIIHKSNLVKGWTMKRSKMWCKIWQIYRFMVYLQARSGSAGATSDYKRNPLKLRINIFRNAACCTPARVGINKRSDICYFIIITWPRCARRCCTTIVSSLFLNRRPRRQSNRFPSRMLTSLRQI